MPPKRKSTYFVFMDHVREEAKQVLLAQHPGEMGG